MRLAAQAMGPVSFAQAPTAEKAPNKLFLAGVGLSLGLSSFVLVEPAPVDGLVLLLLAIGLLAGILNFRAVRPVALIPLMVFVLANILSMYDPLLESREIRYFFITAYLCLSWVFFAAVLQRYGERAMRIMIAGYTIAALISIAAGLLSYFQIIGYQHLFTLFGRPKGTFKDPNVFGPYIIPVALFAIAGLTTKRAGRIPTLIQSGVALIAVAGIFLSYSRACWINFTISVFAYFLFAFTFRPAGTRPPFPISRLVMVVLLAAAFLLVILQVPEVKQMVSARVTSSGLQGYDRDRFRTQRMALQSAIDRPLGIGPGQAEPNFLYSTHSSYMRVLSENGFLGLASFVAFYLICVSRGLLMGWKTRDPFWQKIFFIASACLMGHIVNSGVVDTVHWRHLWFLFALPWYNPEPVRALRVQLKESGYMTRQRIASIDRPSLVR